MTKYRIICLLIAILLIVGGFAISITWMMTGNGCLGCHLNRQQGLAATDHNAIFIFLPGICPLVGTLLAIPFARIAIDIGTSKAKP